MTRIFCLSGENRIVFAGQQLQTNYKQCDARALIEAEILNIKEVERLWHKPNGVQRGCTIRVRCDENCRRNSDVWFDSEVRERDAKEDVADGFHFNTGRRSWCVWNRNRRRAAVRRARRKGIRKTASSID